MTNSTKRRRGLRSLYLAAGAALALGATARADSPAPAWAPAVTNPSHIPDGAPDTTRAGSDALSLSRPRYLVEAHADNGGTLPPAVQPITPGRRDPLMAALDRIGWAKPLDDAGIVIYGAVQASYTYNMTRPKTDEPPDPTDRIQLRMFDHHHDELTLNRLDLYIARPVDYKKAKEVNVGGLIEMQYGTDAAMMHSNGLFDYDYYSNHAEPELQFDITQAFADIVVPVGTGLNIRAGKFATLMGYESCDPVHTQAVQFYSRSFILTFGIPMYQTGVYGTYDITPDITVNAGFTRGWEQSLSDNNDAIDFIGSVYWRIDRQFSAYFAASVGPQQPDDNSHYRTVLEAILFYKPSREWDFAVDATVGFEGNYVTRWSEQTNSNEEDPALRRSDLSPGDRVPVGDTWWGGVALFGAYTVNEHLKVKARGEWFYDADGTRFRTPAKNTVFTAGPMNDPYVELGKAYHVFEFTFGVDWYPFPTDARTLLVRPELRLDWADHAIFGNGHDRTQFTAAVDVIYRF